MGKRDVSEFQPSETASVTERFHHVRFGAMRHIINVEHVPTIRHARCPVCTVTVGDLIPNVTVSRCPSGHFDAPLEEGGSSRL